MIRSKGRIKLTQTKSSVKRFKTKYGQTWRLKQSLDRYFMRSNLEEAAAEYIIEEIDMIDKTLLDSVKNIG